jgi:hypothetical protein
MKYSKRQIEVWKARELLSEKLARMTPEEITAHAKEVAAEWERTIAAKRTRTKTPKSGQRNLGNLGTPY